MVADHALKMGRHRTVLLRFTPTVSKDVNSPEVHISSGSLGPSWTRVTSAGGTFPDSTCLPTLSFRPPSINVFRIILPGKTMKGRPPCGYSPPNHSAFAISIRSASVFFLLDVSPFRDRAYAFKGEAKSPLCIRSGRTPLIWKVAVFMVFSSVARNTRRVSELPETINRRQEVMAPGAGS